MTLIQKLAWAFAAMFIFTVALGYIPGFTTEEGLLLGLFEIEIHDDILHLASGFWAAFAAWRSRRYAVFYFKTFGPLYALDGVLGLITGLGYLDLGIFLKDSVVPDLGVRIAANLPHMAIGGATLFIGFFLSRKLENKLK